MGKEIEDLEQHNTWEILKKTSLPRGANLIPPTWAFNIKRYSDGIMRKHKAISRVRGYRQIKNVYYFESYTTVVSWLNIRMVIHIAAQHGCANWQVDFLNTFIKTTLEGEGYVKIPAMFSDKNLNSEETVLLKLNKSLYRLVQDPCTWYQLFQKGLKSIEFDLSDLDKEI